jgi:hypothetical protein
MTTNDDVFERAGRNLRRAAGSASLLEGFALIELVGGLLLAVAYCVAALTSDPSEPALIGAGLATALVTGLGYALLRGFASVLWLMVDRVLVEAEDDDDASA